MGSGCHAEGSSEQAEGEDIVGARADSGGALGVSQLGYVESNFSCMLSNV